MYEEYIEKGVDDATYYAERKKKRKRRNTIFLIGMIGLVVLIAVVIITIFILLPLWFEQQAANRVCSPRPLLWLKRIYCC